MKMHSSKQLLKIAEGDTKQPFFLTAFGNDINEDDTFSSGNSLDSPLRSLNGSQGFSPSKWKSDAEDTGPKLTSTTTTTDVDPSLNERDNSYSRIICSKAKQPEEGDRRFKFGSLHGERLREMELERHRRLKAIELVKAL